MRMPAFLSCRGKGDQKYRSSLILTRLSRGISCQPFHTKKEIITKTLPLSEELRKIMLGERQVLITVTVQVL